MKNVLEVMRMSFNKQRMILEKCLIVMMLIILSSSMVLLRDQVLNKPIIKNINDSESIPTFYLHGFGGAKYSENYMVNSAVQKGDTRSEEHTSELQSRFDLVCRLLLEKKKYN